MTEKKSSFASKIKANGWIIFCSISFIIFGIALYNVIAYRNVVTRHLVGMRCSPLGCFSLTTLFILGVIFSIIGAAGFTISLNKILKRKNSTKKQI
jgi:hypothetical protein